MEGYHEVGKIKWILGFQRMGRLGDGIFLLQHMDIFPRQLCTKLKVIRACRTAKILPLDISSRVCEFGDHKFLHHHWRIHKCWHHCYQLFRKHPIPTIAWKVCQHYLQYSSNNYRYLPFCRIFRFQAPMENFRKNFRIVHWALIISKSDPFRRSNQEPRWMWRNPV